MSLSTKGYPQENDLPFEFLKSNPGTVALKEARSRAHTHTHTHIGHVPHCLWRRTAKLPQGKDLWRVIVIDVPNRLFMTGRRVSFHDPADFFPVELVRFLRATTNPLLSLRCGTHGVNVPVLCPLEPEFFLTGSHWQPEGRSIRCRFAANRTSNQLGPGRSTFWWNCSDLAKWFTPVIIDSPFRSNPYFRLATHDLPRPLISKDEAKASEIENIKVNRFGVVGNHVRI